MLHVIPQNDTKHWSIYSGPETGEISQDSLGTITLCKQGFQVVFGDKHSLCKSMDSATAWLEAVSHERVMVFG